MIFNFNFRWADSSSLRRRVGFQGGDRKWREKEIGYYSFCKPLQGFWNRVYLWRGRGMGLTLKHTFDFFYNEYIKFV